MPGNGMRFLFPFPSAAHRIRPSQERSPCMSRLNRASWSWVFYDWANSAFATTVMAGFFPIFLKQYWSAGVDATESTFQLGMANSLAGLIVALLAPVLGAIADRGGRRMKFLLLFTVMGVLSTAGLYFVAQGDWPWAVALFVVGTVGFTAGTVFYDALIVDVARPRDFDFISGLGYAFGYLGGGVLFAINVWMTLQPGMFGLADAWLQGHPHVDGVLFAINVWMTLQPGISKPKHAWLQGHPHVDGEQHAAAEIAEGITEAGDEVEVARPGNVHDQRVVEHGARGETHGADHEQRDGPGPVALRDEIQPCGGQHAHDGEQQQDLHAPPAAVGDGPEHRRQQGDDQACERVRHAELEGALRRVNARAPVLLEEYREESRHDGGGEGGIGPVVEDPGPAGAVQAGHAGAPFL